MSPKTLLRSEFVVVALIQDLKITTLADKLALTECLGQWGLSFLLELEDVRGCRRKIIFDTGMHRASLLYNMKQLKVNLCDLDCVVISHGHNDHTSSTVEIAKATGGLKVYAHPHAFLPRFRKNRAGNQREDGVPKGERLEDLERVGAEVILNTQPTEILPGVWITGQIQRLSSFECAFALSRDERFTIIVDGQEIDDQILDDQALWTDIQEVGPFVITGCAHAGILNTLLQVQRLGKFKRIHGLIGGTHLIKRSEQYIKQTVEGLGQFGLELISPCHCTGFKAAVKLWRTYGSAFVQNFSGRVIEAKKRSEVRVF